MCIHTYIYILLYNATLYSKSLLRSSRNWRLIVMSSIICFTCAPDSKALPGLAKHAGPSVVSQCDPRFDSLSRACAIPLQLSW